MKTENSIITSDMIIDKLFFDIEAEFKLYD
jgi:hypothetical protein